MPKSTMLKTNFEKLPCILDYGCFEPSSDMQNFQQI